MRRTPGRGVGHVFVLDAHGRLVRDICVGEGDMYHPGGIDFDGDRVWVPVAEYRDEGSSMVLAVDPLTYEVSEMFRVRDHVSWVACDARNGSIHGGNWGSRQFYTWTVDGRELDRWDNPSDFVDYQDCQYAAPGRLLCAGISTLSRPEGAGEYELGGIAVVDPHDHRIVHESPVQLFSSAGHVVTRNPFALTADDNDLFLHVAPDDGTEVNGTELLTYRTAARHLLRPQVDATTAEAQSEMLRRTAEAAARSVRAQLVAAFRTVMDTDFKQDLHDIVTVHDRLSEDQIRSVIHTAVPDSTIVGEEGGEDGTGRVRWYVDPIDGTSNFARGIALWCVSIAAVVDGRVVAAVIDNPVANEVFSADLSGAWLNGQPLVARASIDESGATIVSSFPNAHDLQLFGTEALTAQAALIQSFQAVRNLGSGALNLAHVAAGWADATMGFATKPWDVAAGVLILEQAGGTYFGFSGGAPDVPSFLAPDYFAVGAGATYPTLRLVVEGLSSRRAR